MEQTYSVCTRSVWIPDLAISMLAHLTLLGNTDPQHTTPSDHKVWKVTKWRWKGDKRKCVHSLLHPFCTLHYPGDWRESLLHLFPHPSQHQTALQIIQVCSRGADTGQVIYSPCSLGVEWGGRFRGWGTQLKGCGCCVVCLLFRA